MYYSISEINETPHNPRIASILLILLDLFVNLIGAGRGGRTPTTLRSADFESAASASSAIPAMKRTILCYLSLIGISVSPASAVSTSFLLRVCRFPSHRLPMARDPHAGSGRGWRLMRPCSHIVPFSNASRLIRFVVCGRSEATASSARCRVAAPGLGGHVHSAVRASIRLRQDHFSALK